MRGEGKEMVPETPPHVIMFGQDGWNMHPSVVTNCSPRASKRAGGPLADGEFVDARLL